MKTRTFVLATLLVVAPLAVLPWTMKYWIGQDAPNHLAVLHILQHLHDPQTVYADYFSAHLSVRPYVMDYWLLLLLARGMSVDAAMRLHMSLLLVAFALATAFFVRRVVPERSQNSLLLVPLAANWVLLVGFYSFALGLLLALCGLALAWSRADDSGNGALRMPALAGASALFVLAGLAHPFSLVLATAALVAFEGRALKTLRSFSRLGVLIAPAGILVLVTSMLAKAAIGPCPNPRKTPPDADGPLLEKLLSYPLGHMAGSALEFVFSTPAVVLLLCGAFVTFRRVRLWSSDRDASLSRAFLALFTLYLLLPAFVFRGELWVGLRPAYASFFFLPALATLPAVLRPLERTVALALVLTVGVAGVQRWSAISVNDRMTKIVEAGRTMSRNATLLPLDFSRARGWSEGAMIPYLHSWGYVLVEHDSISPYLFVDGCGGEYMGAARGLRPLRFKRDFSPTFLPHIEEGFARIINDDTFATVSLPRWKAELVARRAEFRTELLEAAPYYDYVLLIGPPEGIADDVATVMTLERRIDDIWLYRH